MKKEGRERTAHHEAAHAVLAHYLGIGLKSASITASEEDGYAGAVEDAGEWSEESEELRMLAEEAFWLRMAIVRYAGAEGVRMLHPKSRWREGAGNDYQWAAIALEKITVDEESLRCLHRLAMRRARILVEHYWPEIQALATELLAHNDIDGPRAQEIIAATHSARRSAIMSF